MNSKRCFCLIILNQSSNTVAEPIYTSNLYKYKENGPFIKKSNIIKG